MKKIFNDVKTIKLTVNFKGYGCVNFDSDEQKRFLQKAKLLHTANNNYNFAKKQFEKDEDGETGFLYKVSSECIRHEIFKETMPGQNPNIVAVPYVLYNALAMPDFIARGYCFTRSNKNSLKRATSLTITDAVEVGTLRKDVSFDFHSSTINKNVKEEEFKDADSEKKKSTAIYNTENVGTNIYESHGFINLEELQFISDDPTYDRTSLGALEEGCDDEKIFLNAISRNMVNMQEPKFNYYYSKGSYHEDAWGERGLLLNKESVDMIVKRLLKSILNINITRRNAFFSTISVDVDVIMANGKHEAFSITNDNVDDYTFNYNERYLLCDEDKVIENMKKFAKYKENNSEKKGKK